MTGVVLAIDLGTQSLRLSLVSPDGEVLWAWSRPVASRIDGDAFEQDPAEWRGLLMDGLQQAKASGHVPVAIAACGPLAGFVPMDATGRLTGMATTYADRRPAAFVGRVSEAVEATAGADPLALRAYGADPLPQLLFARSVGTPPEQFLDATGYLNVLLTGRRTLNSITALRLYTRPVLDRLGLDASVFGRIVQTGEVIASLAPALAGELGWPAIPVIAAPFDSKCAYLASGLETAGDMADISGTVTSLGVYMTQQVSDLQRRIYAIPFGEGWLVRGSTAMAGGILEWARRQLGFDDFESFDAAVAATPPGAGGVLFLPYLAGERAPLWMPSARGAFLGLTLETERRHMARAVYEGLAFAVRHITSVMAECGAVPTSAMASGGLSRNRLLLQIKADVVGIPYRQATDFELTTRGLALIAFKAASSRAGIAIDTGPNLPITCVATPDQRSRDIYDERFQAYLKAAAAVVRTF